MKKNKSNDRRDFLKKSALITGAGLVAPSYTFGITHSNKNKGRF